MRKLIRSKNFLIGSAFAVALAGLGVAQFALQGKAEAQGIMAPKFEVDPFWPKPLPNHWVLGMSIGVWADTTIISGWSIATIQWNAPSFN
jgi:hypothetical protein